MRKKLAVTVVAIATLALILAYATRRPAAPEAVFAAITGAKPSLAEWRGKPVLLTFWATDCPTCLKEIPELKRLHQRYAPQGLHMVAVAMPYDVPSRVVSFANSYQLPYTVALDPLGNHARAFQVPGTPTTLLLDGKGRIAERLVGDFDPSRVAERIEALLKEP